MRSQISSTWLVLMGLAICSFGCEYFLVGIIKASIPFVLGCKGLWMIMFSSVSLLFTGDIVAYVKRPKVGSIYRALIIQIIDVVCILMSCGSGMLGIIYASHSGTIPGLLTSFELVAALVSFILSIFYFKERQYAIQYIGCGILVLGVLMLTLKKAKQEEPDAEELASSSSSFYFITSVFCHTMWGTFYACHIALVKYNKQPIETSSISIVITGLVVVMYAILASSGGNFFATADLTLNGLIMIGVSLTCIVGNLANAKAASVGSLQLTQTLIYLFLIVQVIFEAIFYQHLPDLIDIAMLLVIFIGTGLILLFEKGEDPEELKGLIQHSSEKTDCTSVQA